MVALFVVVAGCSAVPFGAGGPPEQPDTVTPVPVTDSETASDRTVVPPLPPGVRADGQVDATALSRAHRSFLENRSYTWSVRYDTGADGLTDEEFVRRAVVGNETFLVEQTSPGPDSNTTLYVNGTGGFLRSVAGNDTRYELLQAPGDHTDYAFADEAIGRFLDGPEFDVTLVERGGQTFFRLYAAEGPIPEPLAGDRVAITNFSATAYVTPDGFVRSLAVDYDRHTSGERSHVTFRYDYSLVGDSSPVVPHWTGEVPQRSTPEPAGQGTSTADGSTETPTADGTTETPDEGGTATPTDSLDGRTPSPGDGDSR